MKRILSALLASLMLLGVAPAAIFAEGEPSLTLSESSHLVLDTEKGYVDKIDGTITVADLKSNFTSAITVKAGDTEKADDKFVATDDVIFAGTDSLRALIYGDVDRNGKVNLSDVSGAMKHVARWNPDINADAADVDKSGVVNLLDAGKLLKAIAGFDDISLGNVRLVFENKAEIAENEDAGMNLFFTDMMHKLGATTYVDTGLDAFKIKMAKNEYESCQVLVYSDTAREGLTVELSDFVSEYGDATMPSKIEFVKYYDCALFTQVNPWYVERNDDSLISDDFPEVILPATAPFELKENRAQHFVITAESTKDTPAGMYTATLTFHDADGKEVKKATVYANVWNFTVPDAPYSASLFCNSDYGAYGYDAYFDHMLSMNLSSYVLPVDINSPEADAYMSDPRVTAFTIAGCETGDNRELGTAMYGGLMYRDPQSTKQAYEKVMSNPEWAKKGLFYYTDEPYGPGLELVKGAYEYTASLLGTTNFRNMTPYGFSWYDQGAGIDSVEFLKDYINVWVPTSDAYHRQAEGGRWAQRRSIQKYGEYYERVEAFRERGDDIWWYVCCAPEVPYANYFTPYQGVIIRVLSWQQYFNNVNGVLYYSTSVGWGGITKHKFDIGNGDGTLQYPGEFWGYEGPQASWRLLQIRDGFDDFDYLHIAEELYGREAVMEVVKKVSTGILQYTEDWQVLDAARTEIVKMILAAQGE